MRRLMQAKQSIQQPLGNAEATIAKMKMIVNRPNMKFEVSNHYVLMHDVSDKIVNRRKQTRAQQRLDLLETVVSDKIFDHAASHEATIAAYGQAWALTHFLMETRFAKLMEYYRRLSTIDVKEDEGIPRANLVKLFDDTFGDRTALESEWRSYMRSLKPIRTACWNRFRCVKAGPACRAGPFSVEVTRRVIGSGQAASHQHEGPVDLIE